MPPEPLRQSQGRDAVVLTQPQSEFGTAAILQFNNPRRAIGPGSHRHLDETRRQGTTPESSLSWAARQVTLEGSVIYLKRLSYRAHSVVSRQGPHRPP